MFVNLTNIISLHIRDRLFKFEEQSSTNSINTIHILNSIKYLNPFFFSFIPPYPFSHNFTNRYKDQEFNKLVKLMLRKKCGILQQVKIEHQRLVGKLQQLPITEWKWENITIVFVTRLPRGMKGNDAIWVIMDGLQSQLYSYL